MLFCSFALSKNNKFAIVSQIPFSPSTSFPISSPQSVLPLPTVQAIIMRRKGNRKNETEKNGKRKKGNRKKKTEERKHKKKKEKKTILTLLQKTKLKAIID